MSAVTANTKPIYVARPQVSDNQGAAFSGVLTAAAADFTGTSASNEVVFLAHATDGSYIQKLRFAARGANVQTVARVYINNGLDPTVAANNKYFGSQQLNATSVTTTSNTSAQDVDYYMNIGINPGFRILVGLSVAVAGGWDVTAVAGDY